MKHGVRMHDMEEEGKQPLAKEVSMKKIVDGLYAKVGLTGFDRLDQCSGWARGRMQGSAGDWRGSSCVCWSLQSFSLHQPQQIQHASQLGRPNALTHLRLRDMHAPSSFHACVCR